MVLDSNNNAMFTYVQCKMHDKTCKIFCLEILEKTGAMIIKTVKKKR